MVNLVFASLKTFRKELRTKKVIVFGEIRFFFKYWIPPENISRDTVILCHGGNLPVKQEIPIEGKRYISFSQKMVEQLVGGDKDGYVFLMATGSPYDMIAEFDKIPAFSGIDTFTYHTIESWHLLLSDENEQRFPITFSGKPKIPKVIHYVWFGGGKLKPLNQKCIDSWKKFCPDYEIKRWDETNYDILGCRCEYAVDAYKNEEYAFASDYARVDIIRKYGGIYLDTDVELLRPIDELRKCDFFCGFEDEHGINFGLGFGGVKNHPLAVEIEKKYHTLSFYEREEKILNLKPCPEYLTDWVGESGVLLNGSYQEHEGVHVFPSMAFSPVRFHLSGEPDKNSFSIHHWQHTWFTDQQRKATKYRPQLGLLWQRYKKQCQKNHVPYLPGTDWNGVFYHDH